VRRPTLLATLLGLLASVAIVVPQASAAGPGIRASSPTQAERGRLTAVTLTLPANTAAVDGRVLIPRGAAELMGVAPVGGGVGLRPVTFRGGAWFAAYDLRPTGGAVSVQLVLLPHRSGSLGVRVVVDTIAVATGRRIGGDLDTVARVHVAGRAAADMAAPGAVAPLERGPGAAEVTELVPDGRFTRRDLDTARLEWMTAREESRVCGTPTGDADGDGCVDIADVQSTLARQGTMTTALRPARQRVRARVAADGTRTWTVRSTADTADARPGDGACADVSGRCTLRAAMMEADYLRGDDRIAFALDGTAPVTIQLTGRLPIITSQVGTLEIDGYSQPGARVNSAEFGSDAIPGVELRGNGSRAREVGIRITSPGNTIRGLALRELWRAIMLDGTAAHGNRIMGDWVGITGAGAAQSSFGDAGVLLNVGANHNFVGSPDLADRNVIASVFDGINSYGPGTDGNAFRNNLMCTRPGGGTAACGVAIDHNFGPKENITGGDGPHEGNITGSSSLQGIEYSHGWDPAHSDTSTTWQVNGNRAIGNWIGFRMDGTYDPAYRPGTRNRINGQGINVFDGANGNVVEGNFTSATFDGISVDSKNSQANIVRGNVIGMSPRGNTAAPMPGWGIVVRGASRDDVIARNTIRNAASGGIGLTVLDANFTATQAPAQHIRLTRNIVRDTSGPAIDLFGRAGPDRNDPDDSDQGANSLFNTPIVTAADTARVGGTGSRGATVEVFRADRPAGAFGLPVEFLGDGTVASDGTWLVPVSGLRVGDRVTALQIRSDGNTSELCANVEVVAGPGVGEVVGRDDFGRQVADGWGRADLGGSWMVSGSGFSVADGLGRIVTPAATGAEARLVTGVADVWVTGAVSVDRLPVGGSVYAYVLARADGANSVRGAIRVAPSGVVSVQLSKVVGKVASNVSDEVATSLIARSGAPIRFRMEAVGGALRMRVWESAASEPDAWTVTATDPAPGTATATGFATWTGKNVTSGPVTASLDEFTVRRGS
jgi:hypothetical protein